MDKKPIDNSPEALLARLRQGYKQNLMFKIGGLDVPCRILPAKEQIEAISNAKLNLKIPEGHDRKLIEAIAVQKAVLKVGCTVNGIPYLPDRLLDQLSSDELGKIYDLYQEEVKYADPRFEALSAEQISKMIDSVKKKKAHSSDFFTWQLAAIGKFCLEEISRTGNGRG